ncbi:MAG: glycosyltransferase [Sphingobacteriales bacterium]|nr:glycosyltransferase [Sphingobacteriales bacterium]MBI3720840.1 glycosyltransferase [Sphingobacteriales bacterium]
MKALLLIPDQYSLFKTIDTGLKANGVETVKVEYESFFRSSVNSFVKKYESLPNKVRKVWKEPYIKKVNEGYRQVFDKEQPNLVFIYNNQLIEPETVKYFRTKSKIVFFLGDNPFYTPTHDSNLAILFHADYIMSPDTFWIKQLEQVGVQNLHFGVFGFNEDVFYPFQPSAADYVKYKCDMAYVGTAQKNAWGYKRFLFLNNFLNLDLKAYISGDSYNSKWKKYFPELEAKIVPYDSFNPGFNNLLSNCSKIYPVDLVPSLFNGVHIRIMDCIGSGIMPLIDYSTDLDIVFKDHALPYIKNYNEAERIARHYIKNDTERETLMKGVRQMVKEKYMPQTVIKGILEKTA